MWTLFSGRREAPQSPEVTTSQALMQQLGQGPPCGQASPTLRAPRMVGIIWKAHQTWLPTWAEAARDGWAPIASDSCLLDGQCPSSTPEDSRARGIPPHSRDVAPHVHGVADASAADLLDGHGVHLRAEPPAADQGDPDKDLWPCGAPATMGTMCGPQNSPQPSRANHVPQSTLLHIKKKSFEEKNVKILF